jgi:hypothetical protein
MNKVENRDVEVIDIATRTPVDNILVSEFTTGMEVIKLETADTCLLGNITHIKLTDEFIYIKDIFFKGIYVFDRKGKFIKRLHREGRGPGEYMDIFDFIVDEEQNTLEIFDGNARKLYIYELSDFSFIKAVSIPLVAFGVVKRGNMYYFASKALRNIINEQPTNSDIIAYDATNDQFIPLFDKIRPDEEHQSWDLTNVFTVNSQNDIFVSLAWQNNCYIIEKESIKPILSVYAGSHTVPDRIKNGTYDEKVKYLESSSSNDKYMFIRLSLYEENNFVIMCAKGYSPSHIHYYIRSRGQDYFTDKILNDFIPGQPDLDEINNLALAKDYLVYVLVPDENQPSHIKQHLDYFNVAMEDNPVVLLFKFKK